MDTILSSSTKLMVFKIMGLIFLLNIGIHSQEEVDFCEIDDEDIITETQCNFDTITLQTIADEEKESIVDTINDLRNIIAEGKMNLKVLGHRNYTLPQATSMTVMQWDNALEVAASKTMMDCNFENDVIKLGQFQAVCVYPPIVDNSNTYLKKSLYENFLLDAQSFDVSSLTDYESHPSYQYFTILANHDTLFVGCAMAYSSSKALMSVCYFAPYEEGEHKVLYKQGSPSCSDCPFKDVEDDSCDSDYNQLCRGIPLCEDREYNDESDYNLDEESGAPATTYDITDYD